METTEQTPIALSSYCATEDADDPAELANSGLEPETQMNVETDRPDPTPVPPSETEDAIDGKEQCNTQNEAHGASEADDALGKTNVDVMDEDNASGNAAESETPVANVDTQADLFEPEHDGSRSLTKLPISKIKKIMKFDPEVTMANQDAVFLVAKATELFIEGLCRHAGAFTTRGKRKTVQKRDVELAVDSVENFTFLEGVLEAM